MTTSLLAPSSASWRASSVLAIRADLSVQHAGEPHRSSYPDAAACRAFSSFDQLRIGNPLAVRSGEQRIDAIAFFGIAAIVAPREFVKVAIQVLRADKVVDAKYLALE